MNENPDSIEVFDPIEIKKWEFLYSEFLNPESLLPLFQKIKGIAKQNLAVNASFTTLIPTLTITRSEEALAAAIHELQQDLEESGNPLSADEKAAWNEACLRHSFSSFVLL